VTPTGVFERIRTASALVRVEPMTGIEPAYSAWEADVLPLNYIGDVDWEASIRRRVGHRHRRRRVSGYARRVLLSDRDLRAEIAAGRLGIDPFDDALVQPSSVDVRLDTLFRVFNNTRYTHIDPAQQQDELTSLLGSTLETCTLPEDLAGRLEGKSSLGRLGLLTHSTAGFIDPGFSGHITLELSNVANLPITLWPGMKIGQLCILRLTSPAEHPYGSASVGSKYQGQRGPTPSRSYLNFIRST
jgi:dCTP deaminase